MWTMNVTFQPICMPERWGHMSGKWGSCFQATVSLLVKRIWRNDVAGGVDQIQYSKTPLCARRRSKRTSSSVRYFQKSSKLMVCCSEWIQNAMATGIESHPDDSWLKKRDKEYFQCTPWCCLVELSDLSRAVTVTARNRDKSFGSTLYAMRASVVVSLSTSLYGIKWICIEQASGYSPLVHLHNVVTEWLGGPEEISGRTSPCFCVPWVRGHQELGGLCLGG